ncbi:MAG: hypothetical protein VB126_04790 [Paludibacter sp.]|nr:hypothetical protein [Paludibacter sp.]
MKKFILFLSLFLFVFICRSCVHTHEPEIGTTMICKADYIKNNVTIDSLLFSENDIEYFDLSTNELKLKTTAKTTEIQNFNNFRFYMGKELLFTAHLALDVMSSIINDLVFYQTLKDGKLYLKDGYPVNTSSSESLTIRAQNSAKRAVNWQKFIDRLDYLNKLRN